MGESHSFTPTNASISEAFDHHLHSPYGSVLPLPRRAVPYPWEDLYSLLCRVAQKMGYPDPRWILHPQGSSYRINASDLPLLSKQTDFLFLQQQLLLDEATLYSLTVHIFAPLLDDYASPQPDGHFLLRPYLFADWFLDNPRTRVCPQCLEESPVYDRQYWRMKYIFFCPLHRTRLRDTCPHCSRTISALRIEPFCCPFCQQGDYRVPVSGPIAQDHPLQMSTILFLRALGITFSEEGFSLQQICPLLPQKASNTYVSFLRHIMKTLMKAFSLEELLALLIAMSEITRDDVLMHQEIFATSDATVFFLFHAVFLQWPTQFFRLLDLFYMLAIPPFLGTNKTAVVDLCQQLFSNTWLQPAFQNHQQFYRSDNETASHAHKYMRTIIKQLNLPTKEPTQPQYPNIFTEEKQQGMRPFPRIVPFPWESLASVVARASHLFGLSHPEHLLRTAFSFRSIDKHNLLTLTDTKDYAFLEYILQIERETLYRLTIHQFADPLQRGDRFIPVAEKYLSLETNALHWLFPHNSHTQVCPRCLAEEAYDRLYWTARLVLVCPYHHLRLVQVCPSCKQKIPTLRASVFHCPFCSSGDYRTASPISLSEDHPLAIASALFLQSLGVLLSPSWHLPNHLAPSPLLGMKAKDYFRLLEQIAFEFFSDLPRHTLLAVCKILDKSTSESFAQQENGESDSLFLATLLFHLLFTAWPTRFFTGLNALCRTIRVPPYRRFHYGFEQCRKYFWRLFDEPDFSWLQRTFEQYEQQFYRSTWYEKAAKEEQEEMYPFQGGESLF